MCTYTRGLPVHRHSLLKAVEIDAVCCFTVCIMTSSLAFHHINTPFVGSHVRCLLINFVVICCHVLCVMCVSYCMCCRCSSCWKCMHTATIRLNNLARACKQLSWPYMLLLAFGRSVSTLSTYHTTILCYRLVVRRATASAPTTVMHARKSRTLRVYTKHTTKRNAFQWTYLAPHIKVEHLHAPTF